MESRDAGMVEVIESDRVAVKDFHAEMARRLMKAIAGDSVSSTLGNDEGDASPIHQAFARHRLAHQPTEAHRQLGGSGEREAGWTYQYDSGAGWETHIVLNTPPNLPTKRAPTRHYDSPDICNVRPFYYSTPPASEAATGDGLREAVINAGRKFLKEEPHLLASDCLCVADVDQGYADDGERMKAFVAGYRAALANKGVTDNG